MRTQMLYGSRVLQIGMWVERAPRELTYCPTYYAADHETVRTEPGTYPLTLMFIGGYTVPMPQWLLATIPAVRLAGALYSGFGGVNFAETPLRPGVRLDYHVQIGAYQLAQHVQAGSVVLRPEFTWLLTEHPTRDPRAPKVWADLDPYASAV
jgi:hypothetical protein